MNLMDSLLKKKFFTPASIAARLQESFDRDFGSLWVEGEITQLSRAASGHAYFCLKDSQARLRAVMWKGRRPYAGGALSEGLRVLARGRLEVYPPRGEYQLIVDYLEPQGEGALRLALERLKARLSQEGLFDPARKRALPYWPLRVALISSPQGAAGRDFIETALRLRPSAAIALYPVRVQGSEAAGEIVEALELINSRRGFDLIVLTRGGGSLEDLKAFNEESVARAVAASRTPTLAAIGHSTDLSLCELAADSRAITPTAAAEAVFRDEAALRALLAEAQRRLRSLMEEFIQRHGERIQQLSAWLSRRALSWPESRQLELERLLERLVTAQRRLLDQAARHLDDSAQSLNRRAAAIVAERGRSLNSLQRRLKDLSPLAVLQRGYALVSLADSGENLWTIQQAQVNSEINIRLADGELRARLLSARRF